VIAPQGPDAGPTTTDRAQDGFAGALTSANAHGLWILLLFLAAFGWGALHALSPGHGKSLVAAYLVGTRGTPRHAAILGLTVTATHTVAVFALGLVTLFASQYVLPEDLYPWLGVVSGLMVVAIGFAVMRSRFRRWRGARAAVGAEEGNSHHHDHHHHAPEGPVTMRALIGLGVSGGAVPCPSALVVLVAAISQHRLGLGMALILAFSLGLAATLTVLGIAVVHATRLPVPGRIAAVLPTASALVIVGVGMMLTFQAAGQLA